MSEIRTKGPVPFYLDAWRVVRIGADIGLRCVTCGRRVLIARRDLEKDMKRFTSRGPLAPAD